MGDGNSSIFILVSACDALPFLCFYVCYPNKADTYDNVRSINKNFVLQCFGENRSSILSLIGRFENIQEIKMLTCIMQAL